MSTQAIVVLLLSGFSESFVVETIKQVRQFGKRCQFAGLQTSVVTGELGLPVYPGIMIESLLERNDKQTVLIPPCPASHIQLMTEPRLHRVFDHVTETNGLLLTAPSVAIALSRVGLLANVATPNYQIIQSAEMIIQHLKGRTRKDEG